MKTTTKHYNPVEAQSQSESVSIDVSLVEHMLTLSHEERMNAHEWARELVRDLRQAGKDFYARRSKDLIKTTPRS